VSIIDEILTFSRVEAGKETVARARLDLVRLVRESAELLEPSASARGLALRVRTPDHPVELDSDAGKIRQIVLNLVGNALKFTDRGSVELSVRRRGDQAVLRVRDTGRGIAADLLDRVFEPFAQADQTHSRVVGGTGLGLTVSRRLAQLLGGDVRIRSSVPGEGSTFELTLPCPAVIAPAIVPDIGTLTHQESAAS
jgi:signal transduction histidine kinase